MQYQSLARTFRAVHAVVCNLKIRNVQMAMQRGAFIDCPRYCSVCLSRVSLKCVSYVGTGAQGPAGACGHVWVLAARARVWAPP